MKKSLIMSWLLTGWVFTATATWAQNPPVTLETDPEAPGAILGRRIERTFNLSLHWSDQSFQSPSLNGQTAQMFLIFLRNETNRLLKAGTLTFNPAWIYEQMRYPGFYKWFDVEFKYTGSVIEHIGFIQAFRRLAGYTPGASSDTAPYRDWIFRALLLALHVYKTETWDHPESVADSSILPNISAILPLIPFRDENLAHLKDFLSALPNNAYRMFAIIEYKKLNDPDAVAPSIRQEDGTYHASLLRSFLADQMAQFQFPRPWIADLWTPDRDYGDLIEYNQVARALLMEAGRGPDQATIKHARAKYVEKLDALEKKYLAIPDFGAEPAFEYLQCNFTLLGRGIKVVRKYFSDYAR